MQALDFPLEQLDRQCLCVLVDDSLVADLFGPADELEGAEGFVAGGFRRTDVGYDHAFSVPAQAVLPHQDCTRREYGPSNKTGREKGGIGHII